MGTHHRTILACVVAAAFGIGGIGLPACGGQPPRVPAPNWTGTAPAAPTSTPVPGSLAGTVALALAPDSFKTCSPADGCTVRFMGTKKEGTFEVTAGDGGRFLVAGMPPGTYLVERACPVDRWISAAKPIDDPESHSANVILPKTQLVEVLLVPCGKAR